jgi:3-phenylpropionate/trans-cinnamate dioxygenase ferredoxin subunit
MEVTMDSVMRGQVVALERSPASIDGWHTGPKVDDVQPGIPRRVEIEGRAFVVVRIGDDFYALGDRCTHTGESLAEVGEVDGDEIECTAHGARFELASGETTCLPATRPLPTAEIRAVDGYLYFRLADTERSTR